MESPHGAKLPTANQLNCLRHCCQAEVRPPCAPCLGRAGGFRFGLGEVPRLVPKCPDWRVERSACEHVRYDDYRKDETSIYLYSHDETLAAPDVVEANVVYGTGEIKLASEQIRLSSGNGELASPPVGSVDSLLAKQEALEVSVVLLARIDKDGNIDDLQVISGPESLLASAREAIKQWRFKPYYKSGEAAETEAQITVRFANSAH